MTLDHPDLSHEDQVAVAVEVARRVHGYARKPGALTEREQRISDLVDAGERENERNPRPQPIYRWGSVPAPSNVIPFPIRRPDADPNPSAN